MLNFGFLTRAGGSLGVDWSLSPSRFTPPWESVSITFPLCNPQSRIHLSYDHLSHHPFHRKLTQGGSFSASLFIPRASSPLSLSSSLGNKHIISLTSHHYHDRHDHNHHLLLRLTPSSARPRTPRLLAAAIKLRSSLWGTLTFVKVTVIIVFFFFKNPLPLHDTCKQEGARNRGLRHPEKNSSNHDLMFRVTTGTFRNMTGYLPSCAAPVTANLKDKVYHCTRGYYYYAQCIRPLGHEEWSTWPLWAF